MNIIDLLICLVLAVAVWNGWRRGFILQICSLAALVVALWLAVRYGGEAGAMLRIEEAYAEPAGFVVVLVAGLLVVGLAARIVRKIFAFAGLGLFDSLLGVLVAAFKYLLLLSSLFAALERLNVDGALIPKEMIESSRGYRPVRELSRQLLPVAGWVGEQVESYQSEVNHNEMI